MNTNRDAKSVHNIFKQDAMKGQIHNEMIQEPKKSKHLSTKEVRILAIETSCDETAVSLLEATGLYENIFFDVLGNTLYSQAKKHATFGGVYPSLAKREHAGNLVPLLEKTLQEANLSKIKKSNLTEEQHEYLKTVLAREEGLYRAFVTLIEKIERPNVDILAVTQGPGLEPALWVGINFARALSYVWNIPILPVNHLEGHIIASSVYTKEEQPKRYHVANISFPALGLIVSGGHTEFVHATQWGDYRVVGSTRDDSIGEAFDKVARLLGVPYPGGEGLSKLAKQGRQTLTTRPAHYMKDVKKMPRPMMHSNDLDFSFSGLKTAVLYQVQALGELTDIQKTLFAAEFEEAVSDLILKKTEKALEQYPANTFLLGGGVSANSYIRSRLEKMFKKHKTGCTLRLPALGLSTDNAVMIGMAGYFMYLRNATTKNATDDLSALGNLKF
jgi:N6-L-threonylcarbamoyladenine synthase